MAAVRITFNVLQVIPVFYVFMERKTTAAYIALFEFIKSKWPHWSSPEIKTDFELAIIAALRCVLPLSSHRGCWFHFCQVISNIINNLMIFL